MGHFNKEVHGEIKSVLDKWQKHIRFRCSMPPLAYMKTFVKSKDLQNHLIDFVLSLIYFLADISS